MNEQVTVTQILDEFAKHGHSDKTGKDWSMSRVGLSNGESAFIFNPIAIGDAVEAKENNGYKNWAKVNPKTQAENAKHDEIMKALRQLYAAVKHLDARVARLEGEDEPTTTPADKPAVEASTEPKPLEQRVRETFLNKPDTIAPMNPNDEVDLNDIPF